MSLFEPIPSIVAECDSQALDWGRLVEMVAGFAQSSPGRAWLLELKPSRDLAWIARQHALVDEMRLLLEHGAVPLLSGLFDPTLPLSKARIQDASLDAEEIYSLLLLVENIVAWEVLIGRPPEAVAGRLAELQATSRLPPGARLDSLARALRSRLNPDGSPAEDASPGLKRIRKEIDRQRQTIEHSLRGILRRLSEGGGTQEDLITIRGERFVIPIKPEFKRRIPGVIHGVSSSGQTVYLEPLETIEQNNDLIRLLEEQEAEIRSIFLAMTREIGAEAQAIEAGAAILAGVDTLSARARFAAEFDCIRPSFAGSAEPILSLRLARHPLLEKRLRGAAGRPGASAPVPLTLAIRDGRRQMIVSGPNTGGKTVVLKTAGLLSAMAQAGIPVPAREAIFPLFHAFLADIGDAQSIEQSLSTFSAHILNLARISRLADASSLVLLDELGSATSPEEGAALAVAVAGWFLDRKTWCLISTHHTALKVYAANRPGAINAAVGFDEHTLAPTYELRLGVPGASAGINVARRLGLNSVILEDARARLDTQTRDIAHFLEQLHAQLNAAAQEREALRAREGEVEREKRRLESEGLKQWREKVRDLERQLQSLLKDFAYQARESIRAIDDRAAQQKLSKEAERRLGRLRREFSAQFNAVVVAQHGGADKGDVYAQPHVARQVSIGDEVRLRSLGRIGTVRRQLEENLFEVAVGPMTMRVARDDIAEVAAAAEKATGMSPLQAARRAGISVSVSRPDAQVPGEIRVIGRTAEEASIEVERFLDHAFLAGLARVRIVHGIGKGVLRKTLRAMLERHPHVAQAGDAGPSEGGGGATIVDLRL